MNERELKRKVIEHADQIAAALSKGRDVELRKSANGVSVAEVTKRVISR